MPTTSSDSKSYRFLKIAQVIGSASGGVMSCIMNYYRNIDRTKVQFDFFTYEDSVYDEEIKKLGGNVYHFPNIFKPQAVKVLKNYFQTNNYDIVHSHLTSRSVFVLKAAKQANISVRICHAHSTTHFSEGIAYGAKSFLRLFSKKYATHLAGCSQLSIDWLFGKNSNAFLMKNAIDLERFHPQEKKNDVVTVGFVGRFVFQKNLVFLIKVFQQMLKINPNIQLMLVGDGKYKKRLQKMSKKMQGKVIFVSEQQDIENYYPQFDLFVLTSKFEGMPLVAVEAQACGVPCLLSDKISKEADVGNAKFLPLGNAKIWAKVGTEMLENNKKVEVQLAQHGYDITAEAPKLLQYYQSIAK